MLNVFDFVKIMDQETQTGFVWLSEVAIPFHLTGSRYFGGYNNNSDWDFFAEYSEETYTWLKSCGFKDKFGTVEKMTAYGGLSCIKLMIYGKIHVQLVDNVSAKKRIQELMKKHLPMASLDKYQQRLIWRFAEALYLNGH